MSPAMYRDPIRRCPRCSGELVSYPGREKWRCKGCQSVLVGPSELTIEIGERGAALAEAGDPAGSAGDAAINCPMCGARMRRYLIEDIDVERCSTHGVWFEGGELGRLRRSIASKEAPQPIVRLYEALFAEREKAPAAPAEPLPRVAPLRIDAVEWRARRLCVDGACIGVIGPDDRCKLCGRPAPAPTPTAATDRRRR
jgi:Zn-finger nucleic acid-binding protein